MSESALLLVDLQFDFLDGSLAVSRGHDILPVIEDLLRSQWRWQMVIASRDWHPVGHISFASSHTGQKPLQVATVRGKGGIEYRQMMWPDHCVQDTAGAEFDGRVLRALAPWQSQSKVIVASKGVDVSVEAYSAFEAEFLESTLAEQLRTLGIGKIVVAGVATDYCVKATVLSACELEFEVLVVVDGIAAADEELGSEAITEMQRAGAKIIAVGELAAMW